MSWKTNLKKAESILFEKDDFNVGFKEGNE